MDIPPPLGFKPMQAPELPSAADQPGTNSAGKGVLHDRAAAVASRFNPFQGKKLSQMASNAGNAIGNAASNIGKSITGIFQR
jgi:hypothetical protein